MSPDGRGYPLTITPWGPSLLSRITAAADCYVSLLTHRSQRGETMTPHEALSIMFGPLINRFDIAVLWGLVQVVGFYPPGQMVMLDDGSVAVERDTFRPWLLTSEAAFLYLPAGQFEATPLEGSGALNRLVQFPRWASFLAAQSALQEAAVDFFAHGSPVGQYLAISGRTLFYDMRFDDLHRVQLDVDRRPPRR